MRPRRKKRKNGASMPRSVENRRRKEEEQRAEMEAMRRWLSEQERQMDILQ